MNGHGGKREGAGRKPKAPAAPAPVLEAVEGEKPLDFLLKVQNNAKVPVEQRIRAAIAAAQYVHVKLADGGKKPLRQDAAKAAAGGKFKAAPTPPKLVSSR